MKATIFTFLLLTVSFLGRAQNWTVLSIPTTEDLTTIHFMNDSTGYVFGHGGAVFYTNSGGSAWVNRSAFGQCDILDAQVLSNDTLVAVGEMSVTGSGFWLLSSDGGQNWQVMDSTLSDRVLGLYFFHSNKGFLTGRKGFLAKVTGSSWTQVSIATSDDIESIDFGNGYNGWLAGEKGLLFKTGNGGNTWSSRNSGVSTDIYDVDVMSPTQVMLAGKDGQIIYSGDGGGFWFSQNTGTQAAFYAVDMVNNSQGRAVGELGEIIHTNNQGVVWSSEPFVAAVDLFDISLLHDTMGYVCGAAGLVARLGTPLGNVGPFAANFTVEKDVCVGEEVQFNDSSSGLPSTWVWHFGDGISAYHPHPKHTYQQPGQYKVVVYVYDVNHDQDSASATITVHAKPEADFEPSTDTVYRWVSSTVAFTNMSQGATSYDWDFGNGKTSQQTNPATTYDAPGTYQVKLTAHNDFCTGQITKTLVVYGYTGIEEATAAGIRVFPNPVADKVMVSFEDGARKKITLWNTAGQLVHTGEAEYSYLIDVQAQPAGLYWLVIDGDKGRFYQTILKQ